MYLNYLMKVTVFAAISLSFSTPPSSVL